MIKNYHVYQYTAQVNHSHMPPTFVDGIAHMRQLVLTQKDYRDLKDLIVEGHVGGANWKSATLLSLSYLGRHEFKYSEADLALVPTDPQRLGGD